MSYTKTTWKTGDVITAEKLNKIENKLEALDDSVFIVNIDAVEGGGTITATADKTRQEMSAAVDAGKRIIIRLTRNYASSPLATSIYEMTPNILPGPLEAGGHNFSAEKIIGSVMNSTQRSISTAKVLIGTNNDPDGITVSLYTYNFA